MRQCEPQMVNASMILCCLNLFFSASLHIRVFVSFLLIASLAVHTSALNCLETLVFDMTYYNMSRVAWDDKHCLQFNNGSK